MSAPLVVLSTKPDLTRAIARHLARHLYCSDVVVLHTLLFGAGRFVFPRGLRWDDYPRAAAPAYRPDPQHGWYPMRLRMDGRLEPAAGAPLEHLAAARHLILAVGADARGHAAAMATIGLVGRLREPVPSLRLDSLLAGDVDAVIARMGESLFDPATDGSLGRGEIKRRFGYGWALNAAPILGRTLEAAGVRAPGGALSKYMVQALFGLARHRPMSEDQAVDLLRRWPGTGRYGAGRLGSVISHADILANLVRLGLLEAAPARGRSPRLDLADAGWAVLERLHPDCEDADLPMRLERWMAQVAGPDGARSPAGVAAANAAVDRYLRTWFGKQKRFVAKGGTRDVAALRACRLPPPPARRVRWSDGGLLHSLAALQGEMAACGGWGAAQTLEVAERLHRKGRISAPRADGPFAPEVIAAEMAPALIGTLVRVPDLEAAAAVAVATHRSPCWDDAAAARQAENAIMPSWRYDGDFVAGLDEAERRLFLAVARRFLRQFDPRRGGAARG